MRFKNLLVISNTFPDKEDRYVGDIFVKEQIKYIKNYFENIYVVSPVAYGMEYLRKRKHENYEFDNVKVYFPKYLNFPLFYSRARKCWIDLEARAIFKLIQKENLNFDLIHAHFTWPSGAVGVELKRKLNIPVVLTEHTHMTLYKELKRKNKYYIQTWDLCDAIIRVNKKDIPLFLEVGVSHNKIFHIANGYSPSKFKYTSTNEARNALNLPKNRKIIVNISRLYEEKGQKYLIEAASKISTFCDDFLLFIGGSGPLKNQLENQIKDLKLRDHVKLIGFVPDELLPVWMNACDIFVLPSLSESFGVVQMEAMACGKPVVATRNGGSEEIVINDKLGILVEPRDPEALAQAILQALEREWDHEYIRAYAQQFTWEKIAEQVVGVYEEVMGK